MKKICYFFLFAVLIFGLKNNLNAQTSVTTGYHYVYNYNDCMVPDTVYFYDVLVATNNYSITDSIHYHYDFGDGNDSTVICAQSFYSGSYASTDIGVTPHIYQAPGIYTVTYIASMPDGNADTAYTTVMISGTCNNITGRFYTDINHDCNFNAGDIPVQYFPVRLDYNGTTVATANTDIQGQFSLTAAPGYTYNLLQDTSGYYSMNLPLTCSTFNGMTVTPSPSITQDFIAYDTTSIHIIATGDSSYFNNGNCVPYTSVLYMQGATLGYVTPNDSVDLYINFGDGTDSTVRTEAYSAAMGQMGYFSSFVQHTYTGAGNYNVLYVASGLDGTSDSFIHYNQVMVADTCGNVEGNVYLDNNGNCIFDAGDSVVWMELTLTETTSGSIYWSYTDINGHYSFSVPPGNYTLTISSYAIQYFSLTPTCPASGTVSVSVTSSNTTTADFGLTCPASYDLTANLSLWHGIFPTSVGYLMPYVVNNSCTPVAGSVQLILDPLVHYQGTCDTSFHPTVSGDTLIWTFNSSSTYLNWYSWYTNSGCIEVLGDNSLQPGDSVCFTLVVNPIAGDVNPANNILHWCVPAFVSFDPNAKDVLPRGTGPLGYVPQQTTFDYRIQFQNTGTSPARNIFVLDTLDADLDLSTLVITGSSHLMQPQILPNHILKFNFTDINLPDSTSDAANSHGWVSYRIKAKSFLPNLTPIQNKAGIYFDFNAPVITNSTLNTIYDPSSVNEITAADATIYPNPASSTVEIKLNQESNESYTLTDLAGKIICSGKIQDRSATIDVSKLPQGVYLLNLETEQGRSVHKIVVQH
jgi:hypothetical protein